MRVYVLFCFIGFLSVNVNAQIDINFLQGEWIYINKDSTGYLRNDTLTGTGLSVSLRPNLKTKWESAPFHPHNPAHYYRATLFQAQRNHFELDYDACS
jgi:hypothetical protein